jgi:hypothetical protein
MKMRQMLLQLLKILQEEEQKLLEHSQDGRRAIQGDKELLSLPKDHSQH